MRPRFAEAHLNLASALAKLGQTDEAKAALAECIRYKPDLAQAYNNLGNLLADEGAFAAAADNYRRAIELNPGSADAWYNLGIVSIRGGELETAISQFDRALAIHPHSAETHHNRASALLQLGRFAEGLAEYEWRFASRDFPPFRPRWKPWDGASPAGQTIVLVGRTRIGRYVAVRPLRPVARRARAQVIVECSDALHPILSRTPGVSQWIAPADAAPEADRCVPMMSLPCAAGHDARDDPGQRALHLCRSRARGRLAR